MRGGVGAFAARRQGPPVVEVVLVVPDVLVVVVVAFGLFVVVVVVLDEVVEVVVLDEVVVLVVVEGAVVEVVDDVGVEVVVEVAGGPGVKMFFRVGPLPVSPKIEASGLFAISSTAVRRPSATTKTRAAMTAKPFHVYRRPPSATPVSAVWATPSAPVTPTTPAPSTTAVGGNGAVAASKDSVTGASCPTFPAGASIRSVASTRAADDAIRVVSSPTAPTTSVGSASLGPPSTEDVAPPAATVPPMRRSNVEVGPSGTRTTTCLTAFWPRSIDCDTKAVPKVAAIDPIATPMTVPVTPKLDAMSAAITAPAAEARICRKENFTPERGN